ncbi:DUF4186 domain-containing protein [Acetobacteraceae bacterium]|nr:DUF4186 domain-containing protein [Acetobacteraceae bacterium]
MPKTEINETLFQNALERLVHSKFRSSFHLSQKLKQYAAEKGETLLKQHAVNFIQTRLAPEIIPNDGAQTPLKGHPVFIAQHACGCCCRGCLEKWYHIPKGRELSPKEQENVVMLLLQWIARDMQDFVPSAPKSAKTAKKSSQKQKKPPPKTLDLFD